MISVLCPTRKRPSSMERLAKSIETTVEKLNEVELIFGIDDDDPESIKQLAILYNSKRRISIVGRVDKRIILSDKWNKCADIAHGPIFMFCDDDIVFRVNKWDTLVKNAFKEYDDRIVFVYGRDTPDDPPRRGTHGFLHENWIEVLGYIAPPYFRTIYADTWIWRVSCQINRTRYIPELYHEHLHVGRGFPMDETYREGSQGPLDDVRRIWHDTSSERERDAQKLLKFIEGFKYGATKESADFK